MTAPRATLGGVPVLATEPVAWAVVSGVQPYMTRYSVHKSRWEDVKSQIGTETTLEITRAGRDLLTVEKVTPLYEVQQSDPHRRGIVVADRRWRWAYPVLVRDFNMVRKTGDRTLLGTDVLPVPVALQQSVDQFDYMAYSLDDEQRRWTGKRMVGSILDSLVGATDWELDDWPIQGDDEMGQMSIQNIVLRDSGSVALGRALANVPGADVYVDLAGKVHVFDTTDVEGAKARLEELDPPKASGEIVRVIDKAAVRPREIHIYYVRELELRFDFEEAGDASSSVAPGEENDMTCDNVVPLPDPTTTMADGRVLPQGTWVKFWEALAAWELARQNDAVLSQPWNFDTIRKHWAFDLEGQLGAKGADFSTNASISARVSMIRQHFRQTFQINRRWADRLRDLKAWRVGILDTNTATRGPALTWSQYCVKASSKAVGIIARKGLADDGAREYTNVDQYPGIDGELNSKECTQALVSVVDKDLGIVRVNYSPGPFQLIEATYPSMMVDQSGENRVPTRNLALQNELPICVGGKIGEAGSLELDPNFKIAFLLTGIPAAPNNKRQCHREEVSLADVSAVFTKEFGLSQGKGPVLEVFVPPNSVTARFGWRQTTEARQTAKDVVGFGVAAAADAGIEGPALPGYEFVNGDREVRPNAVSQAAAVLVDFADKVEGVHVQFIDSSVRPIGNVRNVDHVLDTTGEISSAVSFSKDPPAMDAFALQPMGSRRMTLGIITIPGKAP